jgi:uncharacterized SAM-binding protein YcdF (DUF218 family)
MIYLHKILPALASPIMALLALVILSIFTKPRWIKVLTLFVFLLATNPFLANRAIAWLERDFPPAPLATVGPLESVIVLSGMAKPIQTPTGKTFYEFNAAVDRIEAGLSLMQSGRANALILTNGQLPWSVGEPEGAFLRDVAIARGIDPARITLTDRAENTVQEASAIAALIAPGMTVGLVTSAFHMPRALQVFAAEGIDARPIAVDYRQNFDRITAMDFIPSAEALDDMSLFVRELIGRAYYALRT